jgi:hypothetical protein
MKILAHRIIVPYYISYRDDGILFIRVSSEEEGTFERVQMMIQAIGEMVNYKKVPWLVKYDDFALPQKEKREFWSKLESVPYSSAEAYIISSLAERLISEFYLNIEKPKRPTKMFTNEKEAIEWLKTFI